MKLLCKLSIFILLLTLLSDRNLSAQNVALNFDGYDDYIQTTYPGISGAASRTVEAWIRTTAISDPTFTGVQQVICDWGSMATGGRFTVNLLWNNALRVEVGGSGLSGTVSVNDGKWHHVAVVYDSGTSNPYSLYVDGTLDTKGSISTSINTLKYTPLRIGLRVDSVKAFDGDIDEVRVYNFAKTDSMIKLDMGREFCINPSGLVAYYKLNEGTPGGVDNRSKATVYDYSGNGNKGTLKNFVLRQKNSNYITGPTLTGGNSYTSINAFACSSYTSPSAKYTWSNSGNYNDTLSNYLTCDSVITVKLNIGKSNKSIAVSACDSFVSPASAVYKTSGTYTETYPSYKNCDSVVNYVLTILKSSSKLISVKACDSFVSGGGKTYYNGGVYTEHYSNYQNCDSSVELHITLNNSKRTFETLNGCDSFYFDQTWFFQNSQVVKHYTTHKGCDSSHTIDILLKPSKHIFENRVACDSFVSPGGKVYKQSGIYDEHYSTWNSCDSTHTYTLTVHSSYQTNDTVKSCRSYKVNGTTYSSSQVVQYKANSVYGCDSLVTIQLEIVHIDKSISRINNVLTSAESGAAYSWFDCKTFLPVPGENKISFKSEFDGLFAVEVSKDGCKDTSVCYDFIRVGLNPINASEAIRIQPNPNNGHFNLALNPELNFINYQIIDMNGRIIYQESETLSGNLNFAQGLYTLLIYTTSGTYTLKLIIE